jgi:hypothetical protein
MPGDFKFDNVIDRGNKIPIFPKNHLKEYINFNLEEPKLS